jgi:hypothetical protein
MASQKFFIFAHAHLASGSDRLCRCCRGVQLLLFLVFGVGIVKIAWAAIKLYSWAVPVHARHIPQSNSPLSLTHTGGVWAPFRLSMPNIYHNCYRHLLRACPSNPAHLRHNGGDRQEFCDSADNGCVVLQALLGRSNPRGDSAFACTCDGVPPKMISCRSDLCT